MKSRALAVAFLTTLLWSGSYIVNKIAFAQGVGPLTLSGMRYTLGGLTLMLVLRKETGKSLPVKLGLMQGMLCYLIGQGFQYIGQSMTNPTMASLILNSGLVLVIVAVDRIRLHEAPEKSTYWKAALLNKEISESSQNSGLSKPKNSQKKTLFHIESIHSLPDSNLIQKIQ